MNGLLSRIPISPCRAAFDYPLKPGMNRCLEVLAGEVGGDGAIKLEDQVPITEDGYENHSKYPFDAALMGQTG